MDALYFLLGLSAFVSWVMLIVLSFTTPWGKRTTFQRAVTIFGVATLLLFIIGSI